VPLTLRNPASLRARPDIHVRAFAACGSPLPRPAAASQRRDSYSPPGLRPLCCRVPAFATVLLTHGASDILDRNCCATD